MGLFSPQISTQALMPLCRNLATAHDAGIPIVTTLDLLAGQEQNRRLRHILETMSADIRRGSTFGEAARRHARYLPWFFIELVEAGEVGGKLETMLSDLAQYFEDRMEMRRLLISAFTGPAIRLVAAWFLGTFALRLLPQIRELAAGRGDQRFDLPGYVRDYWVFQGRAMLLAVTVLAFCVLLSRLGVFGWVSGIVTTHVWPFAGVTRRFALARFFRSMSLLFTCGLNTEECIRRSAVVTGSPYIERDLLRALPRVRAGDALPDAFGGSRYLTHLAREMLRVGDTSGRLAESMQKVAQYHLAEATQSVRIMTHVVTVAIIFGVAVLIGYIVVTFFGTLYANVLEGLIQ